MADVFFQSRPRLIASFETKLELLNQITKFNDAKTYLGSSVPKEFDDGKLQRFWKECADSLREASPFNWPDVVASQKLKVGNYIELFRANVAAANPSTF